MNDTHRRGDELVAEYLAALREAAEGLPPGRRDELVEDLRGHIVASRAEFETETETDVRMLLHRLGDPATIVAEARVGEPPPPPPVDPVPPSRGSSRATTIVLVVLAVVIGLPLLLCIAGVALFLPVGNHQQAPDPPVVQSVDAPSR